MAAEIAMPLVSRWEFPEPPFEPPIGEFVNFCGAFVKIRYIVIVVNIIKMVGVSVVPVLQVDKPGLVFESIWKLEGGFSPHSTHDRIARSR